MMQFLAEQFETVSKDELKQSWGGLIFMGLFVIALMVLFIWWLKRQT